MRVGTAIVFIAIGIWLAFNKPELAQQAYVYIELALEWIKFTLSRIMAND